MTSFSKSSQRYCDSCALIVRAEKKKEYTETRKALRLICSTCGVNEKPSTRHMKCDGCLTDPRGRDSHREAKSHPCACGKVILPTAKDRYCLECNPKGNRKRWDATYRAKRKA